MDVSLLILCMFAGILAAIAYSMKGWRLPVSGLWVGGKMFWEIAPRLLLGFTLSGLLQVLIPVEYIARTLGEGSGLKGVIIAMVAGALAPGGPYVNFPLVAVLYKGGAGIGPLATFLTSWGVIPLNRALVYEIPLLGAEFTLARYSASLVFPLILCIITPLIFKFLK